MTGETDILIRTKLHRPQLSADLVARPMLLEWLSQHRRRRLTLVSASAGYGKTTLISSWLETVESPSAWLSLDEYDDDLVGFLTYFIAAIQTIFPEAGRETQDLLVAPILPPEPVLARSLIRELARLTDPFILVLDDYHVIREAAIHDLLSELLRYPLRAMHLVITTRSAPLYPYSLFYRRQLPRPNIRPSQPPDPASRDTVSVYIYTGILSGRSQNPEMSCWAAPSPATPLISPFNPSTK